MSGRWGKATERRSDEATKGEWPIDEDKLRRKLAIPSQGRLYYIRYAMKMGWTLERIHELTHIDPWFLAEMKQLVDFESKLALAAKEDRASMDYLQLTLQAKQWGYSDVQLASIMEMTPAEMGPGAMQAAARRTEKRHSTVSCSVVPRSIAAKPA